MEHNQRDTCQSEKFPTGISLKKRNVCTTGSNGTLILFTMNDDGTI